MLASSLLPVHIAAQAPGARFAELDRRWAAGENVRTLNVLRAMSHDRPHDVEVLWRLAWVKTDIGRGLTEGSDGQEAMYRGALRDARRAVEAGPGNAQAHLVLAISAGLVTNFSGISEKVNLSRVVRDAVNRAIDLNPRSDLAYFVRGIWHLRVAGVGSLTRALVAVTYGGLPDASYGQAERDFRRAIGLRDRVIHRLALGRTLMEMHRPRAARAELHAALAMSGRGPAFQGYRRTAREMLAELNG
jgi:hypothetical protein